jgi:hypothetical protein
VTARHSWWRLRSPGRQQVLSDARARRWGRGPGVVEGRRAKQRRRRLHLAKARTHRLNAFLNYPVHLQPSCNLSATLARLHWKHLHHARPPRQPSAFILQWRSHLCLPHRHSLIGCCWASDNTLLICCLEYLRPEQETEGWSRLLTSCGYNPVAPPSVHGCINAC